ncbi:aldo-keto reductase family 1 member B1-like isoform X2 [Cylas formicarius]|nr:aldo-keto reductase family 1 member B1-like isoform X2 [Cylas formicarius]
MFYENEAEVGKGIQAAVHQKIVKRQDLFITSKLWCNFMRPHLVESTIKQSLQKLGLDYLDLYLIHWPTALKEGGDYYPKDKNGKILSSDVDYINTWKAMEEVYKNGLAKSIGVSNFNKRQLERLLKSAIIKPVTNQVECHPYLNQAKLIKLCKSLDIVVTAYSPLGSPGRPWAKPGDLSLTEDPRIKGIASNYKKTPAQIVLRYLIQKGVLPIPKSSNKSRIQENINVFDFELSKSDVKLLDTLDCNERFHRHLEIIEHREYPFNDEY